MKESVGYTVSLNIVITFIIIIFAFLSAILVYFKSNKVSNVITETIEEYEGYTASVKSKIDVELSSLGYNKTGVNCAISHAKLDSKLSDGKYNNGECRLMNLSDGSEGYCVFLCTEKFEDECYYYYKISTNMMLNIPIINDLLNIPVFSNTNRLYDFGDQITCKG